MKNSSNLSLQPQKTSRRKSPLITNDTDFKTLVSNGIIKFNELKGKQCLVISLNFNDPITIKAAENMGYVFEDCVLKEKEDYKANEHDEFTVNSRYSFYKQKVKQAIVEISNERKRLKNQNTSNLTSYSSNDLLYPNNYIKKYNTTLDDSKFPHLSNRLLQRNEVTDLIKNKNKLLDFTSREKMRKEMENKEKNRNNNKREKYQGVNFEKMRRNEILEEHRREVKSKCLKNKIEFKRLSEKRFNELCEKDRNETINSISNQIKERKKTLSRILEKKGNFKNIDRENELKSRSNYRNLQERLNFIEKQRTLYCSNKNEKLTEISDAARKSVQNVFTKFQKAEERKKNLEKKKVEDALNSLIHINDASNVKNQILSKYTEVLKKVGQEKMKNALEKAVILEERKLNRLIEKQEKSDMELKLRLAKRKSLSPIKAKIMVCQEAQEYNIERIKRLRQLKKKKVYDKFKEIDKNLLEKRNQWQLFVTEKTKRDFDKTITNVSSIQESAKILKSKEINFSKNQNGLLKSLTSFYPDVDWKNTLSFLMKKNPKRMEDNGKKQETED